MRIPRILGRILKRALADMGMASRHVTRTKAYKIDTLHDDLR